MNIMFVRHGDPDYETDSLLPLGKKEAEAVADRLENAPIDAFYVSPLGRARETAAPTLQRRGEEAKIMDWLREFEAPIHRPDVSEKTIPWDWLPEDWTKIDAFYDPDGWYKTPVMREGRVGEEFDRVSRGLDTILAEHGYVREGRIYRAERPNTGTLCFFCHYGVAVVMISHLLSVSPMPLWHGLVAAPGSISMLTSEERREGIASFRMNHYGDTAHLERAGLGTNVNGRFTEIYSDFSQRHD